MRAASSRGTQDLTTTLLTCLVILCFEAWNGHYDLAVRQIQTGLRLIQAWREDILIDRHRRGITASPCGDDRVVNHQLIATFTKLDVQAISFAEESNPERHSLVLNAELSLLDNMPLSFDTVRQAEPYENAIIRQSMRFFAVQVPLPRPRPPKRAFPINAWWGIRDPDVVAIQQSILKYISAWHSAFEPLWTKLQTEGTDEETLLIASTLRLHIEADTIALLGVCCTNEEDFDAYTDTFSDMITLSSTILLTLTKTSPTTPKFSFDSHVVIPLHMIAHKCRDPLIRRRAIELLTRYPRREGVWDSALGARIGSWAMAVEEEFGDEEGRVPGWARIHGVVFERDGERRGALLGCEQKVGEGGGWGWRRKIITW
ncbi:uncharacterized protein LY89DRAFT_583316 [Mollisia scopiformis]|uniref:Uncharacterized protein n=1 Tax=Mollisia scopiformis TaxID=149040 RepID=A0A194XD38_MOLSC|nr:uncharacterized protein LY89DRAFT_583316 [Mollisia scopiformis]KUJ18088.1 hypothetical protein LY89DRAFT_583316 [Mollisia scopiformis]